MPIRVNRGGPGSVKGNPALYRLLRGEPFRSRPFSTKGRTITGTTRDASGVALAGVTLDLFTTADDVKVASMISDAAGAFAFDATAAGPYYLVAYKAGAPDVAGTTVNTLIGV